MKIIFITREGYGLPGARIRCYNFARELRGCGVNAEVLSFADVLGAKDGENEMRMDFREKIRYNLMAFKRLIKERDSIFIIQRFNYHSFAPYLAHLFNRNRIILDLDDWEMRENPKYYFGFYPSSKAHYFTGQIAKRSIFCIAASRFLEEFLSQFNKRAYYIPSGVDTELFKPSLSGLNTDKIIFSWIGTFHKREYIENIEFALGCFAILRKKYSHIYFEIRGEGIYRKDLEKKISEFKDRNIFLRGWISPEDVPGYLDGIHIGLFPVARETKFNQAKSPTKVFEYMAMAKPVVAGNVGDAKEIIYDAKNGFLASTKEEFAEKMRILIDDADLRKKMGKNARETIERNYSLPILGIHLYEALNQIDI